MKTVTNVIKRKFLSSPRHRNSLRTSEIKGERSWGNHRPALVIVCLLLVGTKAIAAPSTDDPCRLKFDLLSSCSLRGQQTPPATGWCNIVGVTSTNYRGITANGIPNHCVDESYHFPIAEVYPPYHFKVPLNPTNPTVKSPVTPVTVCPTPFSIPPQRFGVALNGVVFDPEDVAIWMKTGPTPCGSKKGDCIDNLAVSTATDCSYTRWQLNAGGTIDPSWMCCSNADLEMDDCIAHTQKGGLYHYHRLTAQTAAAIAGGVSQTCLSSRMTLVGWAFDGFPVYWKYGQLEKGGTLITMKPQYSTNTGPRAKAWDTSMPDVKRYPLGTFVNDWVYTGGPGRDLLDECNGKVCYSPDLDKITYCYFITEEYPYIPRCFRGTPNEK